MARQRSLFRTASALAVGWLGGAWLLLQRLPLPVEDAPAGALLHFLVVGGALGMSLGGGVAVVAGWMPRR